MYAKLRSLLSTAEAIILWKDLVARIRRGQATMLSCPGAVLLQATSFSGLYHCHPGTYYLSCRSCG